MTEAIRSTEPDAPQSSTTSTTSEPASAGREVVIVRIIDAPRALVSRGGPIQSTWRTGGVRTGLRTPSAVTWSLAGKNSVVAKAVGLSMNMDKMVAV